VPLGYQVSQEPLSPIDQIYAHIICMKIYVTMPRAICEVGLELTEG